MSRLAGFEKTSTGIVIGRSYIPRPPREMGSEAERIQVALLARPAPLIDRLSDAFERASPPVIKATLIGGFAFGLVRYWSNT